ncbi:MAG TPA: lipase family protein [Actinocrinis sp.]|uniref:lipase family protein n=1 Tax=Actinocrinis sp. TaxID=1920516 RepID=UPI002DDCEF51|nr:lipase family protein [Actinocrinis sp.]HEV2345286.1 lipase family protein [Actinocrinis sp.]
MRTRETRTAITTALLLGVTIIGGPMLAPTADAAAATGTAAGETTIRPATAIGNAWQGTLIHEAPLPAALQLDGAGQAWRIWYESTAWDGAPTVVSGTLTVPPGEPPAGGWPVVSYSHGFGGTADQCAPSVQGPSPWERALNDELLAGGYAIAATDYDGIGTPGEPSIVNGPSEAYSVIDIVRAARRVAPLSRDWISVGYSLGGHAALWSAHLADSYAPELRHRGTVALANFIQFPLQLATEQVANPAAPLIPGTLYSGVTGPVTHPGWDASQWFTPLGLGLIDKARTECVGQLAADVATVTNGQVFKDPAAAAAEFNRLLDPQDVPITRYPEPVRLAHGTADGTPAAASALTAQELAAAGTDVTYLPVPGADHFTLLPTIAPQVLTWARQMFAGH